MDAPPTVAAPSLRRLRARALGLVVLGAIITLGPAYGHFFATGSHEYLGWKMFSRQATDFCAVAYWRPDPSGRVPLDRFAVLGYDPDRAPADLRRVR